MSRLPNVSIICGLDCHRSQAVTVCGTITTGSCGTCKPGLLCVVGWLSGLVPALKPFRS